MTINEKGVEVGDFVRITNNDYPELNFVVGNYYEVLSVDGGIGLADGDGDCNNDVRKSWTFFMSEIDDVRKKSAHKAPSLSNKKIWVKGLTEEQKKAIQDVAFEQGFGWAVTEFNHQYLDASAYFITNDTYKTVTYLGHVNVDFFNEDENEEITYEQIFGESPSEEIVSDDSPKDIFHLCPSDATHYGSTDEDDLLYYKNVDGVWYAGDKEVGWFASSCSEEDVLELIPLYNSTEEASGCSALTTLVSLPTIQQMCAEANAVVTISDSSYEVECAEGFHSGVEVYSVDALIETLEDITTIRKLSAKLGWS